MLFAVAFVIKHFSDTVQYQANGFLEKNRDTISKELVNVMRESKLTICRKLMSMNEQAQPKDKASTLDGRVKINAAKQLVSQIDLFHQIFANNTQQQQQPFAEKLRSLNARFRFIQFYL